MTLPGDTAPTSPTTPDDGGAPVRAADASAPASTSRPHGGEAGTPVRADGAPTPRTGGEGKAQTRRTLRAMRAARTRDDRDGVASALAVRVGSIPEVATLVAAGDGVVAAYASLGEEPGTDALRALLALSGVRVLLPVIRADGGLEWGWDSDELVPRKHRLAIPEPAVDESLGSGSAGLAASRATVVLVPALAVDVEGHRLGQGGGYYDRLLADVPESTVGGPLRVAVVHDDEVLDTVPHESHDERVDAILTPTSYRLLRQSPHRHP